MADRQLNRWVERPELLRAAQSRAARRARARQMSAAAALVLQHALPGAPAGAGETAVGEQAS